MSSSAPPPRFVAPPPRPLADPERETAWRPWMAPSALIGGFLAAFMGQLIIAAVGSLFGTPVSDPSPAVNILATLWQDICFVGAAIFLARSVGPVSPGQFGLRKTDFWRAVLIVVGTFVAFTILSGLWSQLIGIRGDDELPDSLGVDRSTYALVAVCVLVTVVAPLAEEFLFRGFFFGALRNWRGVWPAAIITGVVFGAIHGAGTDAEFLPLLMLLGFLLCVVRWVTRSLLPCIALHAVNNSLAFGVTAADWQWWAVVLLIVGAVSACMLICWPFVGRRSDQAIGAAT
ncbi:CPBP family intramembrane glutamic endopeptidase [Conexibacter sp. CPCC 206217]|uniref:CPBP family intramembrane glutamic endopeptidase n=1 Tax=Conexibacter sp. CPCC 206217 TaxID=3064574 RepID=UPI002716BB34|nr:CPBP family intramembrane glutamic endopeptidase [Conexibacter sp. CPCC 206217]MDO8211514.1 CPBP family intramembrane metalloprotease [Conexibacter sp. CPCC 206217]